jgi:hypothetical protein
MCTDSPLVAEVARRLGVQMAQVDTRPTVFQRRTELRFSPLRHVVVTLDLPQHQQPSLTSHGYLVDLGSAGACIALEHPVNVGAVSRFIIATSDTEPPLCLFARVRHCTPLVASYEFAVGLAIAPD